MTNVVAANVDVGESADHANGIDTPDCEELGELANRVGLAELWRGDLTSAGYWGLLKAIQNRRTDAHECELSAYV